MFFSLFLFHGLFPLEYVFMYTFLMQLDDKWNFKHEICAKFHQKNIKISSKEYVMWKHFKIWPVKNNFLKLYKPIRVWLWLVAVTKHTDFFFVNNTFISNIRLKLAKNQAKAKQHAKTELLLFENYLLSSSTLSSKSNKAYSKKCANKCVCFNEIIIIMKMKMEMKKRSHRYYIYKLTPRHFTIILNIKCVGVWWCLYVLINI